MVSPQNRFIDDPYRSFAEVHLEHENGQRGYSTVFIGGHEQEAICSYSVHVFLTIGVARTFKGTLLLRQRQAKF